MQFFAFNGTSLVDDAYRQYNGNGLLNGWTVTASNANPGSFSGVPEPASLVFLGPWSPRHGLPGENEIKVEEVALFSARRERRWKRQMPLHKGRDAYLGSL